MADNKYNIIIFGMNRYLDWKNTHNYNRCYHILRQLIQRDDIEKILYIDYLPVKRANALRDYSQMFFNSKKIVHLSSFSICRELKISKLYQYSGVWSVINWNSVYEDLKKTIRKLNLDNLILWSYYPLNVDFFDLIDRKMTIFDIDSDWQNKTALQHGHSIDYIDVLRKNYNSISNNSDIIFTSSDELLELFMGHDNSYWIPSPNFDKNIDTDWSKIVSEMFNIINNT